MAAYINDKLKDFLEVSVLYLTGIIWNIVINQLAR